MRYTEKDARVALRRFCKTMGHEEGHYRKLEPGEVSTYGSNTHTTIPGGWDLDYNPTYGGCRIEEIAPDGGTWTSTPFGATRMSPREFCAAVDFTCKAVASVVEPLS